MKDFKDFVKEETATQEEAKKYVKAWQKDIKEGDHYVMDMGLGFLLYGEILKPYDSFYETEEGSYYRFAKAYSIMCPKGEAGDVHIASITKLITKEEFDNILKSIKKDL